jgi:transcriptional regulator with XRE-family HTH domain
MNEDVEVVVSSRAELGDFLRSRREKLSPDAVGLKAGRRRRTPGLRREEVAELAGIGVDWYIRLEQGRNVSPSVTTIDALARALRLGRAESSHLRRLARGSDRAPFRREAVPASLQRMVDGLPAPAYITGRRWDLLAWNAAAADLFIDFSLVGEADRNILLYMLCDATARRLFADGWEREARRMLGQFRINHDRWSEDPAFVELIERLRAGCLEFEGWWTSHDVRNVESGRKRFHHERHGVLEFEHASFQANDDPALKLVIYTRV